MDHWIVELAGLLLGFALLAQGAHWLVDGGATLARRWGVSTLMVGLTVIAWGTSMPEVVVSGIAAWEGNPGIALGNVLGSNVANIGLVLGTCAVILPSIFNQSLSRRDSFWLVFALAALWFVCGDRSVQRVEAALLLVFFLAYNVLLWKTSKREEAAEGSEHGSRNPWRDTILGSIAIAAGAQAVVKAADGWDTIGLTGLAHRIGLPDTVIGLTVVAIGTSLPELAAGIGSALKKHHDISLGNVVGSNVFNTLAVIGIAGLIAPFDAAVPKVEAEMGVALERDFPVNVGFAVVLLLLPLLLRGRMGRAKGFLILVAWVAYMLWVTADQWLVSSPAAG